ncbi:MAG: helix-turn-helix transcriptional regulator [Ruminococcaceae bacterium]|nr:helix-turn-helix transcriptional regulator [Oscillospiraceae bacterium]
MKKIEFNNNKNIISARLKKARTEKRLSQSELAVKLQLHNINIDQQMISKIENNERQVTDYELACICKCLNVKAEWMLADFEVHAEQIFFSK